MALAHPEWDLFAYLGVDSNYCEAEVLTEGADPPAEGGVGSVEVGDPAKKVGKVKAYNAGETQATGATGETVLIVDDEPTARLLLELLPKLVQFLVWHLPPT